jgi:pimeloyl-ACP methyl ester carboxylesterase
MIFNSSNQARLNTALGRLQPRTQKRFWIGLLFLPVLVSSPLFAVRWSEYAMTFHPEPYSPSRAWELPKGGEEVSFLNRDQLRLHGWFVNSQSQPALATVIFFHGNAGNISNVGWVGERLAAHGFNALLFDYRGYGKSEGEITDERDIYADADAAYKYVVDQRGIAPERVILYGHSLGTTAAVDLASRERCGAIILESGLSSASDMASIMLPWIPKWLHALGKNRFESAKKLASVYCPVLVTHGEPDNVVPTEQGRALFSAAHEPKKLMIFPGAGHVVSSYGGDKYFSELAKFIQNSLK